MVADNKINVTVTQKIMFHSAIPRCTFTPINIGKRKHAKERIILKTRTEVNVNVTVTKIWYAKFLHLKMNPTSNSIDDMLWTLLFYGEVMVKVNDTGTR